MRWSRRRSPLSRRPVRARARPAVGESIPYSVGRALPDRSGEWIRAAQIQMFNPGDLWEHINGAAEQYLAYGFQDLATTRYTSDQTRTVVVAEIYRMGDARGAFGIYRQEVSPTAKPVALGVEGRASSNTIRFWLAEFYVKLTTPPGGGTQRELEALGAAVAKGLGSPGTMPAEVGWFPSAGQVPDSVRFVPADALGQACSRTPSRRRTNTPASPRRRSSCRSTATRRRPPPSRGTSRSSRRRGTGRRWLRQATADSRPRIRSRDSSWPSGPARRSSSRSAPRTNPRRPRASRTSSGGSRLPPDRPARQVSHEPRRQARIRAGIGGRGGRRDGSPGAGRAFAGRTREPRVRRLKPLGKTGWKVGDISAGSGQRDPAVLNYMFECGINLIDTGAQYAGHEELIGKVLPKWRDKVFVLDKWDPPLVTRHRDQGRAARGARRLAEEAEHHLRRLHDDPLDRPPALRRPRAHPEPGDLRGVGRGEAAREGPVHRRVEPRRPHDRGDGLGARQRPLRRHPHRRELPHARRRAAAEEGPREGRRHDRDEDDDDLQVGPEHPRAAERADQRAAGLPQVDARLGPVRHARRQHAELRPGGRVPGGVGDDEPDRRATSGYLETVAADISPRYCRPGCGACHDVCPHGVPVADILRYQMYFEHYGEQKFAMQRYGLVPASTRPARCAGCAAPCEAACPYGLRVRERLAEADRQLRFA